MNNIFTLDAGSSRNEVVQFLQSVLEDCVNAAAAEAGVEAVQQFFSGYKDNVEALRLAA